MVSPLEDENTVYKQISNQEKKVSRFKLTRRLGRSRKIDLPWRPSEDSATCSELVGRMLPLAYDSA